jgi:signal transduction histidine kinase
MSESYLDEDASGAEHGAALARTLLARLLPQANTALLVTALLAEGDSPHAATDDVTEETDAPPPLRELRRVRRQFALGETARAARHDLNNPLTALLAEAQLLELEELPAEHRASVVRIVELARRVVAVARRLDARSGPTIG